MTMDDAPQTAADVKFSRYKRTNFGGKITYPGGAAGLATGAYGLEGYTFRAPYWRSVVGTLAEYAVFQSSEVVAGAWVWVVVHVSSRERLGSSVDSRKEAVNEALAEINERRAAHIAVCEQLADTV